MHSSLYGSPFKNLDSGIKETKDKENFRRLNVVLANYIKSEDPSKLDFSMYNLQSQYGKLYGPIIGLAVQNFVNLSNNFKLCTQAGHVWCHLYTSNTSFYLPKLIKLCAAFYGLKWGFYAKNHADHAFYCKNFEKFPKEIQRAVETYDARWAHKYLNVSAQNTFYVQCKQQQ